MSGWVGPGLGILVVVNVCAGVLEEVICLKRMQPEGSVHIPQQGTQVNLAGRGDGAAAKSVDLGDYGSRRGRAELPAETTTEQTNKDLTSQISHKSSAGSTTKPVRLNGDSRVPYRR